MSTASRSSRTLSQQEKEELRLLREKFKPSRSYKTERTELLALRQKNTEKKEILPFSKKGEIWYDEYGRPLSVDECSDLGLDFKESKQRAAFVTSDKSALQDAPVTPDAKFDLHNFLLTADVKFEDDLLKLGVDFAYDGFNPLEFAKVLRACAADEAEFLQDMKVLIMFYLHRGTRAEKAMKKMKTAGVEKLDELIKKYYIRGDARGAGAKVITIGRIVQTFPNIVASCLFAMGNSARIVGDKGKLPICLCFPGAGSIIPRTEARKDLMSAWQSWVISFSKVINPTTSEDWIVANQQPYMSVVIASPIFDDKEREAIVKSLGL